MRKDDPYYDRKVYHMAGKHGPGGAISALCYTRPHAIDLGKGQTWTLRPEAVTCPRCKKALALRASAPPETPA